MMLPPEFEESIARRLGTESGPFFDSLASPPPVSIRLHPLKGSTIDTNDVVPWTQTGRYLESRPVFTLDPLFHAGAYYVQEASSMLLEQAVRQNVDLSQTLTVLDLCAAPGGKSTHILSLINRDSLLVSNEVIRSRANILSENIQKWGYPNVVVTNNDPSDFSKLKGLFDVMVIDAPCSGEGLFRKDAAAADEWSPENVQLCASRQRRIVSDAWDALAEGGILLYCTCTYNESENEENLKWLQDNHSLDFLPVRLDPSWGIEEIHQGNITGYRCWPHRVRGEGFFLAAIRKKENVDQLALRPRSMVPGPGQRMAEQLRPWLSVEGEKRFFQFNDLVFFFPGRPDALIDVLLQSLKIVYAGCNMATTKGEKLIPEHPLALSNELDKSAFGVIDLTKDDALRYLRKETLPPSPAAERGFALVSYRNVPLGWVNVLQNRMNNLYPSSWRIRM